MGLLFHKYSIHAGRRFETPVFNLKLYCAMLFVYNVATDINQINANNAL